MSTAVSTPRIPRVVPVLALSIFALGTSEFMITGLLPEMARDLGVTIPQTGYLISAFAVGMIVGAPVMALVTLRWPQRTTLVAALLVFVAGHVLGAVATGYAVVLVARVVTALATATFWVVAAVLTVSVVAEEVRARALAVLLAGLTVATVLGIPLGTVIGQGLGWRATFWAVAALALVGLAGVLVTVPRSAEGRPPARLADELAVFGRPPVWLALGTTALYQAAAVCVFAYVAPLLTEAAGLEAGWVPLVLLGYGLGCLAGISVGGRLADARPWSTLFTALGTGAVIFVGIGLFARVAPVAIGLIVLLGFVAFLIAAPLNARVFVLAGAAPTLASAANTSAFNVGNAIGPALGGAALTVGWGWTAPAWIALVLIGGAMLLALAGFKSGRAQVGIAQRADGGQDRRVRTVCGWGRRVQRMLGRARPDAPGHDRAAVRPLTGGRSPLLTDRPGPQTRGGARLDQVDGTTCGSAVLVALAAWADPREVQRLDGTVAGAVATGVTAGVTVGFGARYDARQKQVHRESTRFWPQAFGTTPWGMTAWLRRHAPGAGPYRVRLVDDTDATDVAAAVGEVGAALAAGRPVPLLVGPFVPRHYCLALSAEGQEAWRVYEPTSGEVRIVPVGVLGTAGLAPLLGFPHLHAVLLPR